VFQTDDYPPWNQELIREGKPMKPAPFTVNFVEKGKYRFDLRRYPIESNLALNRAIQDALEGKPCMDKWIKESMGKLCIFKKHIYK